MGSIISSSVIEVIGQLMQCLGSYVPDNIHFTCGYIEPSHQGMCRKHRWLHVDEYHEDMYKEDMTKRPEVLWHVSYVQDCHQRLSSSLIPF